MPLILLVIAFVLIVVPIMAIYWVATIPLRIQAAKRARQKIDAIVAEHRDTLTIRRRQLILTDPYGNAIRERWEKEAGYFWSANVAPALQGMERGRYELIGPVSAAAEIEATLARLGADMNDLAPTFSGSDPLAYELYCADLVRARAWDAKTTGWNNDQGSDVIATRDGVKLVIQCKLYSRAVGNGAVQEVAAARSHEGADFAAVVTNTSFTTAAKSLAQTNSVALLHHEELQAYVDRLAIGPPTEPQSPPGSPRPILTNEDQPTRRGILGTEMGWMGAVAIIGAIVSLSVLASRCKPDSSAPAAHASIPDTGPIVRQFQPGKELTWLVSPTPTFKPSKT